MQVRCDCGTFQAELTHVPAHSPGRLVCHCRDCQSFLRKLGREDLLDPCGGTEVIPVYPGEIRIIAGREQLICNRITANGPFRWSTRCCNSPVGNAAAKFPWFGVFHNLFRASGPDVLDRLGPVRARIYGRDARGTPPGPTSAKIGFRQALTVLPFVVKGFIGSKYRGSPFFEADHVTPIVPPRML